MSRPIATVAEEVTRDSGRPTGSRALQLAVRDSLLAAAWLVLAFSFLVLPEPPSAQLDPSWRIALAYFFDQRIQFGRDVIFTYGPLGFLQRQLYMGSHLWRYVACQLVIAAIFATIAVAIARRLGILRGALFAASLAVIAGLSSDALYLIMVALLAFEVVGSSARSGRRIAFVSSALLAALGLVKFTNFLLALFAVGAGTWERYRRGQSRAAAQLLFCFAGALVGAWVMAGQNVLNLPLYLIRTLQLAQGYEDAMALPTPEDTLTIGLTVLGLLVVYITIYVAAHQEKSRAFSLAAVLAAFTYIAWKHGFVRADDEHMLAFFMCAIVSATAFPVLLDDPPRFRLVQQAILGLTIAAAFFALNNLRPTQLQHPVMRLQRQLFSVMTILGSPSSYRRGLESVLEEQRAANRLPRVQQTVGNHPIDVLGYEQAVALLNGLHYQPRPAFQSYFAYNEMLADLNRSFYESNRAPEFVLLRLQTIDGRLATLDDARLLRMLPLRYRYVLSDGKYELWQHQRDSNPVPNGRPAAMRNATFGARIELGPLETERLWATIDIAPSLLGRLWSVFYKPPIVSMTIEDTQGRSSQFRLPIAAARAGFILNPVVEDTPAYVTFSGGFMDRRVRRLTVQIADGSDHFVDPSVRVELTPLTVGPVDLEVQQRALALRFNMFKTIPRSATAAFAPTEVVIAGHRAIMMHAPSTMQFDIPVGARYISGRFGFLPGAYEKGGRTDGAVFRATCTAGTQSVELFARALDPVNTAADRGLQRFDAGLPLACQSGHLRLDVGTGRFSNPAWDWTAWTDVEID